LIISYLVPYDGDVSLFPT